MGLFSTKTKSKSTVNPSLKDWAAPLVKGYASNVTDFMNTDPLQYVAPTSALQSKAFGDVQGLGGWKPYATQAADAATEASGEGPVSATATLAGTHSILDNGGIERYLDPALQSYVNATLAAYDDNTARQYAQLRAQGAKTGAFGGSRAAIGEAQFGADTGRNRALTEGDLRSTAYSQAMQGAISDAERAQQSDLFNAGNLTDVSKTNANFQEQQYLRKLQAAGLLRDISSGMAGDERADVALTGQLGDVQRGIASEYTNARPTQLQLSGTLLGMLDPSTYTKVKTKGTTTQSGGLGTAVAAGLAQGVGSAIKFSDRRLKEDVARIGDIGALGLYRFRYIGDDTPRIGVMADEVAIHAPHALGPIVNGFATVDYGKLGLLAGEY